jgi:hypothetical protein
MIKIARIVLIFALCVVVTLPVAAENKVYLTPQQSNATYCNTTAIEIWVNATELAGGQINLAYNSNCANTTNWVQNTTNFPTGTWQHSIGGEWITFSLGVGESKTGKYRIGTLTVHCVNNSQDGCETNLSFIQSGLQPSKLFNKTGHDLSTTWINGTFICGELQSCLGTCCNDAVCSESYATNMTCKDCTNLSKYWQPNKDSACFDGNSTSDLCLDYCPHCTDSVDNDYDGSIDYPSDGGCTCGLDPSEVDPLPPIPEASSLLLLSIGLCALVLMVRWQRKK